MTQRFTKKQILFMIGIILVSFNLRPAITSVGPLIGTIRDQLGLANWNAGLITSLPLLAFACMSPIAPKLRNKYGNEATILIGLVFLLTGILIRTITTSPTLYLGTIFIGLGIAICNVLLPGIIKEKFPNHIGTMTGVYTTCMSIFAAIASGISIPLAKNFGLGWQNALGLWAFLAIIGIIVWFILYRKQPKEVDIEYYTTSGSHLYHSPLAWQVTLFMGMQSFMFYVTISWLPEIIHAQGFTISTGGWLLSYMQFVSLPATFLTPIIAGRMRNQQGIMSGIGIVALLGYGGLLFGGSLPFTIGAITLIGFALGSSISLALALLGMRATTAKQAAELSGMAQSFGYLLAAAGPITIGLIFDFTQTWNVPLFVIIVISILMTSFGLGATRDKFV